MERLALVEWYEVIRRLHVPSRDKSKLKGEISEIHMIEDNFTNKRK